MFEEAYMNFNIKHKGRYRSVRVPTYLILDYIKLVLNKHINELGEHQLKKYKEKITMFIQKLSNENTMLKNQDTTFVFYINRLIYQAIATKNNPIISRVYLN